MIRTYIFILLCTGNIFCSHQMFQQESQESDDYHTLKNRLFVAKQYILRLEIQLADFRKSKANLQHHIDKSRVKRTQLATENAQLHTDIESLTTSNVRLDAVNSYLTTHYNATQQACTYIDSVIIRLKSQGAWYTQAEIDRNKKADEEFWAKLNRR